MEGVGMLDADGNQSSEIKNAWIANDFELHSVQVDSV
jgi:hypothetical protein